MWTWRSHPSITRCQKLQLILNPVVATTDLIWWTLISCRSKYIFVISKHQNSARQFACLSIYTATFETRGLPMWARKYCPTVSSTVSSTVSIRSVNLSCCSNMMPDTRDSSLSVMPLSAMDVSELAPDIRPRLLALILSKLRSSSMTCLTGCMRKLTMSQRTHLGRSTAGCTILYLIKKPSLRYNFSYFTRYCPSTAVPVNYAHNYSHLCIIINNYAHNYK